MTPERRKEICFILLLEIARKEGMDLRKFRRDIGTQAAELDIPVEKYRELMNVAAVHVLNGAIEHCVLIPAAVTNLPKEELHALAEQVLESRIFRGRHDFFFQFGSILKKRVADEEEGYNKRILENLQHLRSLGISVDEFVEFFEYNIREFGERIITMVKEKVTVVVEQGSKA